MKVVHRTIYVSSDGKEFDDEKSCQNHEDSVSSPKERAHREIQRLKSLKLPNLFEKYKNSRTDMRYWRLVCHKDRSPHAMENYGRALINFAGWTKLYKSALQDLVHYRNVRLDKEDL